MTSGRLMGAAILAAGLAMVAAPMTASAAGWNYKYGKPTWALQHPGWWQYQVNHNSKWAPFRSYKGRNNQNWFAKWDNDGYSGWQGDHDDDDFWRHRDHDGDFDGWRHHGHGGGFWRHHHWDHHHHDDD